MHETVYFKLTRDQARTVEEKFFPFMLLACDTRIRNQEHDITRQLQERCTRILLLQVEKIFARRLASQAQKMKFNLELPNAISLYTMLMLLPIPGQEFYLQNLRDYLTKVLHQQLLSPAPAGENLNLQDARYPHHETA